MDRSAYHVVASAQGADSEGASSASRKNIDIEIDWKVPANPKIEIQEHRYDSELGTMTKEGKQLDNECEEKNAKIRKDIEKLRGEWRG